MNSIFEINDELSKKSKAFREIFNRIYDIRFVDADIVIPDSFKKKVIGYFSSLVDSAKGSEIVSIGRVKDGREKEEFILEKVEKQKVLKIYNRFSGEGTLFNYLRSMRPGVNPFASKGNEIKSRVYKMIEESRKNCDFCEPLLYTPEDSFGRIRGKFCITSANMAKYDKYHSLIIFDNHNPLEFNPDEFSDYIETFCKWYQRITEISPEYIFPLLIWNCLPRAGASKVHGHMQILAGDTPYPRTALLLESYKKYQVETGRNYFEDIVKIHDELGLVKEVGGVKMLSYLTPVKEREVMVFSESLDKDYRSVIYKILRDYIDRLQVYNFNMSIQRIILDGGRKIYITRLVDRGNPLSIISDFASMEIYAASVVAGDPAKLW